MNIIKIENRPNKTTPSAYFMRTAEETRAKITLDVNCPAIGRKKKKNSFESSNVTVANTWNSNEERTSSTSPTSIETGCMSPIISNRKEFGSG
ncbi:hypothetical protein CDAR_300081 [Caerostris darwini]|uniref:Uncharacterized protein n=1 Tax=Caerostris darwini TaxID=1538125 RepID=A0AAV4W321_9ARAC|nr:hypothetical protein CDAR_300081 [Caerostris darwini]